MVQPQLIIGLAGPSASGKTHLVDHLKRRLGARVLSHFDLDGYHLHSRAHRLEHRALPDDPRENNLADAIRHLISLRNGSSVQVPAYDHRHGLLGKPKILSPKPLVVVEGLHALMLNRISEEPVVDFSIFISPDEDLRRSWKVHRDVQERGYSYANAVSQVELRRELERKYIFPQQQRADLRVVVARREGRLTDHKGLVNSQFLDAFPVGSKARDIVSRRVILGEPKTGYGTQWFPAFPISRSYLKYTEGKFQLSVAKERPLVRTGSLAAIIDLVVVFSFLLLREV